MAINYICLLGRFSNRDGTTSLQKYFVQIVVIHHQELFELLGNTFRKRFVFILFLEFLQDVNLRTADTSDLSHVAWSDWSCEQWPRIVGQMKSLFLVVILPYMAVSVKQDTHLGTAVGDTVKGPAYGHFIADWGMVGSLLRDSSGDSMGIPSRKSVINLVYSFLHQPDMVVSDDSRPMSSIDTVPTLLLLPGSVMERAAWSFVRTSRERDHLPCILNERILTSILSPALTGSSFVHFEHSMSATLR